MAEARRVCKSATLCGPENPGGSWRQSSPYGSRERLCGLHSGFHATAFESTPIMRAVYGSETFGLSRRLVCAAASCGRVQGVQPEGSPGTHAMRGLRATCTRARAFPGAAENRGKIAYRQGPMFGVQLHGTVRAQVLRRVFGGFSRERRRHTTTSESARHVHEMRRTPRPTWLAQV